MGQHVYKLWQQYSAISVFPYLVQQADDETCLWYFLVISTRLHSKAHQCMPCNKQPYVGMFQVNNLLTLLIPTYSSESQEI